MFGTALAEMRSNIKQDADQVTRAFARNSKPNQCDDEVAMVRMPVKAAGQELPQ
jgi:hypothetical protein